VELVELVEEEVMELRQAIHSSEQALEEKYPLDRRLGGTEQLSSDLPRSLQ